MGESIRRGRAEKGMQMRNGRIFLREDFLKSSFFSLYPYRKNTKLTTSPEPALLSFLYKTVVVGYYLSRVVFASQKQLFYNALRNHVWEHSAHFHSP